MHKLIPVLIGLTAGLGATPAGAAVSEETTFVFNSFSFLIHGLLVMWMAAGFTMLEAGLVRTRNVSTICLKNVCLYSIACLTYFLVGYNLMYLGVDGGFLGTPVPWGGDDAAALNGDFGAGYAAASDWFFQAVFVATAASIVSGTLAERIRLWPFLLFVVILTAGIYPIQGAWTWGAGWLDGLGFADFAGSTIVHSVGGWAALAGAIVVGARRGKFDKQGRVHPMPGSNLPLATLGTWVLWMGWFGFNGGSQLAMGSGADVVAIANIFVNTNIAAVGGLLAATVVTQLLYGKVDLTMALNGALAGLVSITAGPLSPTMGSAVIIGAVGGILVVFAVPLFDRVKVDDVVGAISVHLVAGIWGTMAVPITNEAASFGVQAIGVVSVGAFVFAVSLVVWLAMKYTIGIRAGEEEEANGLDRSELGLEAYPEFGRGSATT